MTSSKQEMAQSTLICFLFSAPGIQLSATRNQETVPALLVYPQNFDPEGERSSGARHTAENLRCKV